MYIYVLKWPMIPLLDTYISSFKISTIFHSIKAFCWHSIEVLSNENIIQATYVVFNLLVATFNK